jgi:AcrR family transcriptional regulator
MSSEARARHIERRRSRAGEHAADPDKPTRRSGDETWSELLRVSAEAFARKGYRGTSLQEIAEALGMLKGSLYYYINTKEDLLYEVVRTSTQASLSAVEALSQDTSEPGLDRLDRMMEVHIRELLLHLDEATVYLNDVTKLSPSRRRQLPDKQYAHIFHSLIIEGQKDGSIRSDLDDALLLRTLLGYVNSVFKWYDPADSYTIDDVSHHTRAILRAGLRPQEQPL